MFHEVVLRAGRRDQVGGEGGLGGAERPYVQVVNLGDAGEPAIRAARMAAGSVFAGAASSARSALCSSRDQVPQVMTATMTRLITGSIQVQPVNRMAAPESRTPNETSASAAMCRKAPRTLRSPCRPRMNISAVPPLIRMPAAATHMTMAPPTGAGWPKRWMASMAMAPAPRSSTTALISDAMMLLRPQP